MRRIKNEAPVAQVQSLLKELYPTTDERDLRAVDGTDALFLASHVEFVVRLLRVTRRPTVKILQAATELTFECDPGLARSFASATTSAVSHCRSLRRNVTTGAKLDAMVLRVVQEMKKPSQCTAGRLHKAARALKRRVSQESEASVTSVAPPPAKGPMVEISSGEEDPPKAACSSSTSDRARVLALYTMSSQISVPAPEPTVAPELPAPATPAYVSQHSTPDGLVRVLPDGSSILARMEPGPTGFAVGHFGPEVVQTEIPNLALPSPSAPTVMKRPVAAKICRRPANGICERPASGPRKFLVLWYRVTKSIALRRNFGDKGQVCQVKTPDGVLEESMRTLTNKAVLRLTNGESTESSIRAWMSDQLVDWAD